MNRGVHDPGDEEQSQAQPPAVWVKRLRARYPGQTQGLDDARLEAVVREALTACIMLEIIEERDIFRAIALRVLLTPEQRQSKLIKGALLRIMCNLEWDAKKRLDFVYRHIVGRSASPDEPDIGPSFVPPTRDE